MTDKKATKVLEPTKAALVREVEQKFRLKKFELDSLERANKATRGTKVPFFWFKIDSKCLLSLQRGCPKETNVEKFFH